MGGSSINNVQKIFQSQKFKTRFWHVFAETEKYFRVKNLQHGFGMCLPKQKFKTRFWHVFAETGSALLDLAWS